MRSGVRSPLSPPSRLDENQGGFFHTFCGQEGLRPTKDRKAPDGVARPALSLRIFNEIPPFDTVFQEQADTFSWKDAAESVAHLRRERRFRLIQAPTRCKSRLCLLFTEEPGMKSVRSAPWRRTACTPVS